MNPNDEASRIDVRHVYPESAQDVLKDIRLRAKQIARDRTEVLRADLPDELTQAEAVFIATKLAASGVHVRLKNSSVKVLGGKFVPKYVLLITRKRNANLITQEARGHHPAINYDLARRTASYHLWRALWVASTVLSTVVMAYYSF